MLQFKSFDIKDGDALSQFVQTNPIAQGQNILVSNGTVIIPFDDGQAEPNSVKVLRIKEHINNIVAEVEFINHSSSVLNAKIAKAKERLFELNDTSVEDKVKDTKEVHDTKKDIKDEIKAIDNIIIQLEAVVEKNVVEVQGKLVEKEVYEQELEELCK